VLQPLSPLLPLMSCSRLLQATDAVETGREGGVRPCFLLIKRWNHRPIPMVVPFLYPDSGAVSYKPRSMDGSVLRVIGGYPDEREASGGASRRRKSAHRRFHAHSRQDRDVPLRLSGGCHRNSESKLRCLRCVDLALNFFVSYPIFFSPMCC
jgi:hypothetical protein